jgi:hypothetical protein
VTQVEVGELAKPLKDQVHQPLAFLSGSFKGAASRWPIVEKEAYAIVETCKRLKYLLLRERGFHLFTDHRNLQYIFNPTSVGDLPTVDNVYWSKEVQQNIQLLQESIDLIHKNERERKRQQGKSSLPNLDVGDFVLVNRTVEVPNKLALQ